MRPLEESYEVWLGRVARAAHHAHEPMLPIELCQREDCQRAVLEGLRGRSDGGGSWLLWAAIGCAALAAVVAIMAGGLS